MAALKRKRPLKISYLRDIFVLDRVTGELFWKGSLRGGWNGKRAGSDDLSGGYRRITIKKTQYKEHQIVWAMYYGEWPKADIDHINGKRNDNRPRNLRLVTLSESRLNRAVGTANTSGHKWVCWENNSRKWLVRIVRDGKAFKGRYRTFGEACAVAKTQATKMHGEFFCSAR